MKFEELPVDEFSHIKDETSPEKLAELIEEREEMLSETLEEYGEEIVEFLETDEEEIETKYSTEKLNKLLSLFSEIQTGSFIASLSIAIVGGLAAAKGEPLAGSLAITAGAYGVYISGEIGGAIDKLKEILNIEDE